MPNPARFSVHCVIVSLLLLLGACSKTNVGNGGGYLGGDDASTESQVRAALVQATKDYEAALVAVTNGVGLTGLYASAGCDDGDTLCHESNLMSDAKRQYVRDLLIRSAPEALRLLRAPLSIAIVADFSTTIVDGDGHARDADAATRLAYGSSVLLRLPALMTHPNAELRGIIVSRLTHELLHQLMAIGDIAQTGPFTATEGAREALTFAGTVMRVYSAGLVTPTAGATPSPSPSIVSDSTPVASLGIPGGAAVGAPASVTSGNSLSLFVVGKQDRIVYMNTRVGNLWSGFVPMGSGVKSDADGVGAAAYDDVSGSPGIIVGVTVNGKVQLYGCVAAVCNYQSTVRAHKLLGAPSPDIATALPPTLGTRVNDAGLIDLYVWVTGVDSEVYMNWGRQSPAMPLADYYSFSMGSTADPVTLVSSGNDIRMSAFRHATGATYSFSYDPATDWSPLSADPFTSAVSVAGTTASGAYVYAVVGADGRASLWSQATSTGRWGTSVSLRNTPTNVRPAVSSYSGYIHLFTLGRDGLIYETIH